MNNQFHNHILRVAHKRGLSLQRIADALADRGLVVARQFSWEISKRPTMKLGQRVNLLENLARLLGEPMSRLAFLGGLNPWADKLDLYEQTALWEFIERIVQAKQNKSGKPPVTYYHRLCNELFGGLDVITPIEPEEMAELLKGNRDSGTA